MERFKILFFLVMLWAIVSFFLSGTIYAPILNQLFSSSVAFTLLTVVSFVSIGVFGIALVLLVIRLEHVLSPRKFFKIEILDTKGIWLAAVLVLAFDIVSALFLQPLLFQPISNFLGTLGLPMQLLGLASANVPPLAPLIALFLTVFLVLFFWIEIPEEIFFRGYVQNALQDKVGKNAAMFISAAVWDIAHLFALGSIVERFFLGLIFAYVFKIRQNTTGVMIFHSVGNRSLLLAITIPAIWGLNLTPMLSLALSLMVLLVMLACVIAGWRLLKLDRGN